MSDTLVRLEHIDFTYPSGRVILRDCNLQLQASQRIGLTGSIGSGKTTLIGLIVGLLRPTSGRIEVFGQTRQRERDFEDVRQKVGMLFQDSDDQLFCSTVAEDVAFGPMNLGKTREQARQTVTRTLESLGLPGYESRITYQLSGGEKRLVALASVLAMEPEVLLLDEPTSGLDAAATQRVMDVLLSLPQAMLIVSHDRQQLQQLTSRCLQMVDGHLEG
jgi:cobalt/nickel transport system ATP-binding protein